MGSFLAFSMLGLFPNPGQNVYLITPPYFPTVAVTSPLTNRTATVTNVNFDPTYQNVYIQNATLNGRPYTKNWIDHSFFLEGGDLVLTLGAAESSWGTQVADLPPSLSPYEGTAYQGVGSTSGNYTRRWNSKQTAAGAYSGRFGLN